MGRKMIGRMAAGVCSICICYGLAVQAFQGKPTAAEQAVDTAVVEQAAAPAEETPDTLSPEEGGAVQYDYDVPRRHGGRGKRHGWHEDSDAQTPFGQSPSNQEPSGAEEDEEEKKKTQEQEDSSDSEQKSSASGDPPTLNQFLSALRCGGCGHNCSLLNPRCMKGRSKAERAQTEYAQTYGSDSK